MGGWKTPPPRVLLGLRKPQNSILPSNDYKQTYIRTLLQVLWEIKVAETAPLLRLVSTLFATQSKAKTSNIPHQLYAKYVGTSFQFIASQDRCDQSGSQLLRKAKHFDY